MPQHLVCLTFDVDNASVFIARGATTPTAISRGDYGVLGTRRLLKLMREREVPGTFFVPGHTIQSYPDSVAEIVAAGHEIGHHGWTHRIPVTMEREEEEWELVKGLEAVTALTGRRPSGYRSPAWDLGPNSIELLLKHGFAYDSSLMGDDYTPYFVRENDRAELKEPLVHGPASPLIEMPISWTLDDFPAFEYVRYPNMIQQGLMSASAVLENWLGDFEYMVREQDWGVLTYTFHPHVIGRGHRILMVETMIDRLRAMGATFVTMETAVEAFRQRLAREKAAAE